MLKPLPSDRDLDYLVEAGRRYRRAAGLIIGALVGLVFGLTSQGINSFMLPGLDFYQPPFGPIVNAVLCFLSGALLGLVSAWPQESPLGVFLASIAGALIVFAVTLADPQLDSRVGAGLLAMLVFLALPFAAAIVPIAVGLRWAANKQEDAFRSKYRVWGRILAPLVLLIAAGGLAATALYPSQARPRLLQTNDMVKASRAASNTGALPPPFQVEAMDGLLDHVQRPYTLEWNRQFDRYGSVISPNVDMRDQSIVVVRFEDGWTFACLFVGRDAEPLCKHIQ